MNQFKIHIQDPTTLALLFSIFAFIIGFIGRKFIKPLLERIKKSGLLILIFLLFGCHSVTPANVDQNIPIEFVVKIIDKTPPVITLLNDHLEYIEGEQDEIDFDEIIIINEGKMIVKDKPENISAHIEQTHELTMEIKGNKELVRSILSGI